MARWLLWGPKALFEVFTLVLAWAGFWFASRPYAWRLMFRSIPSNTKCIAVCIHLYYASWHTHSVGFQVIRLHYPDGYGEQMLLHLGIVTHLLPLATHCHTPLSHFKCRDLVAKQHLTNIHWTPVHASHIYNCLKHCNSHSNAFLEAIAPRLSCS